MNPEKLNKWLTLIANVGVLLGIIALVVELQQTQTSMLGEISTVRAQIAGNDPSLRYEARTWELVDKIESGVELTEEEVIRARMWLAPTLRHFENMHYQYELGILDQEIWESNFRGLGDICRGTLFRYVWPISRWEEADVSYRESFAKLVAEPCSTNSE